LHQQFTVLLSENESMKLKITDLNTKNSVLHEQLHKVKTQMTMKENILRKINYNEKNSEKTKEENIALKNENKEMIKNYEKLLKKISEFEENPKQFILSSINFNTNNPSSSIDVNK